MARIPYPDTRQLDEAAPVVQRIVAERGGLLNLYRMLLHAPPVAEGWLRLMTAVRQRSTLSGRLRELVILWIGIENGAAYEVAAHTPIGLAEGIGQEQIDALAHWESAGCFDAGERAALAYAQAMTRSVHVPDTVATEVRVHFNAREVVELTVTIASYNMVSRFLEAIGVDPEPAKAAPTAPSR